MTQGQGGNGGVVPAVERTLRRARPVLHGLERFGAVAVPVIVIAVLSLFSTVGWLDRNMDRGQGEYLLFVEVAGSHTKLTLTVFLISVAVYTAVFLAARFLLRRVLGRADGRKAEGAPARESADADRSSRSRPVRAADWLLARWWRVSLLLLVLWAPILLLQFPGYSNADFVMQAREILSDRGTTKYPTFDVYPIARYLVPDGDVMLSNHHNAFLTLVYGNVMGLSLRLFGNFDVGLAALTTSQMLFTLVAFGRAANLLGRWVRSDGMRILAIVTLVVGALPIAFWSMSVSKNPLFAAAFCWALALAVDHVRSRERIPWHRMLEWGLVTLIAINAAKFATPLMAVLLVLVLLGRWGWGAWRTALVAVAIPLVLLQAGLKVGVAQEWIIPGDPMAGKGVQVLSMGLTLKVDPDALSEQDRADLEKIFDVDLMREKYKPATMGPIRGAGYREGAYQWRTVTAEEASRFNGIWLDLATDEPALIADGVLLKSYRFFDPVTHGRDNRPTITTDDAASGLTVTGPARLSDDFINTRGRETIDSAAAFVNGTPGLRFLMEAPLRTVLVILLAILAISLRRPSAWIWALPLALHAGVLLIAPVDSSGRYALGITYFLPFALLALAASREWVSVGQPGGQGEPGAARTGPRRPVTLRHVAHPQPLSCSRRPCAP